MKIRIEQTTPNSNEPGIDFRRKFRRIDPSMELIEMQIWKRSFRTGEEKGKGEGGEGEGRGSEENVDWIMNVEKFKK